MNHKAMYKIALQSFAWKSQITRTLKLCAFIIKTSCKEKIQTSLVMHADHTSFTGRNISLRTQLFRKKKKKNQQCLHTQTYISIQY